MCFLRWHLLSRRRGSRVNKGWYGPHYSWIPLRDRPSYIRALNGSQTFIQDKETLENEESSCILFVFAPRAPTRCPPVVKYECGQTPPATSVYKGLWGAIFFIWTWLCLCGFVRKPKKSCFKDVQTRETTLSPQIVELNTVFILMFYPSNGWCSVLRDSGENMP